MRQKTGWLEKHVQGVVQSIVEVKYHRTKVKKTPRKKLFNRSSEANPDESLYFVIDKRVSYGDLFLTGDSVFSPKEILEVHMFVARHKTKMRVLARVIKMETFFGLKRPVFRAEIHFAAVNKEDFLRIQTLERQRQAQQIKVKPEPPTLPNGSKMTLTFKRN